MVVLICDKIGSCTLLSLLFHYITIATKIGEATPTMTSGENAILRSHFMKSIIIIVVVIILTTVVTVKGVILG